MKAEERKELFAEAWKEVFQTDEVKEDDNFFGTAGDSIKAVQLAAWLAQKGVKLDLMNVFTAQTFGGIAETLTDTDPMYVPEKILTKEMAEQEMSGQRPPQGMPPFRPPVGNIPGKIPGGAGPKTQDPRAQQLCDPKDPRAQQLCDPKDPRAQQLCDPKDPRAQQLCDPKDPRTQQLCDPKDPRAQQLCDPKDPRAQQLCDPKDPRAQQLCDPNDPRTQQLCDPNNSQMKRPPMPMGQRPPMPMGQRPPMPMGQRPPMPMTPPMPMMPAYGIMMVPVYIGYPMMAPQFPMPMAAPQPMMPPMAPQPMMPPMPMGQPPMPMMPPQAPFGQGFPPQLDKYLVKPADAPIENPNVIQIEKPKIAEAQKSAEEVLDYVLNGLLPGFDKESNLFEQGLTSFDVMKIVTRCGQYGYRVDMADIFLTPTFEEIVSKMK